MSDLPKYFIHPESECAWIESTQAGVDLVWASNDGNTEEVTKEEYEQIVKEYNN